MLYPTCLFNQSCVCTRLRLFFDCRCLNECGVRYDTPPHDTERQVLKEGGDKSMLFSTLETLRDTVDNLVDGYVQSTFVPPRRGGIFEGGVVGGDRDPFSFFSFHCCV